VPTIADRVPRQPSGFSGRRMACGLAIRVMTDDHPGCRAGPAELRSRGCGIAPGGTAAAHTV